MALTPPNEDQYFIFARDEDGLSEAELEWLSDALQQATDLMEIATGLTDMPTTQPDLRIMTNGILDMTLYLMSVADDRAEMYSPFNSERMGSYSYSKMSGRAARATQTVAMAEATGVPWFDTAVRYFNSKNDGGTTWHMSESVFEPGYQAQQEKDHFIPDVFGR